MNNKTNGVHLNRTNKDSPIISRGTTKTPDTSLLTTVNNTFEQGGLNALNEKPESEKDTATTDDKEAVQQLCEMLIEVTDTEERDTGEIFDFYEEFDSEYKEEEVEEGKPAEGWGSDTETQNLQREMLSINTVFDNKKNEEELPIKCEDPGPCLVTCRIKDLRFRAAFVTLEHVEM
ncbi:hypothetical protein PIB30_074957 [Stylosanthes scabra]|uniref:Uncharacterized protein n=1 Tax=Stylosanthes scabra TaxID=79078 RepID=A0ABU6QPE1_9FABA|nr:hypothetical protein [Stylosanthes scabra]